MKPLRGAGTGLAAMALVMTLGAPTTKRAQPGVDSALVAVMAYHVRHEAVLAGLAADRATGGGASDGAGVARSIAIRARVIGGQLDDRLGQWGISAAQAAALRASATDPSTANPSAAVHLACSLQGPLTDLDQLRAAGPQDVRAVFAAAELTDALEGVQLVETAEAGLDGPTRSLADLTVEWHRLTIRSLSPYVLPTDRAFAATFNQ